MYSNLRKIYLCVLALALVVLPMAGMGATTDAKQFSDVLESNPFASTLQEMRTRGLMKGYPDGTAKPDNSISRAEFITIVVAATIPNPTGANCFPDVKEDWYAKFVCPAKAMGWVRGYDDGNFKPANNINFAEAATIINRAYKLSPQKAGATDPWYKPFVTTLEAKNAIPVTVDYPEKKVSRAETAEMVLRLTSNDTTQASQTYAALMNPLPTAGSCPVLQGKAAFLQYRQDKQNQYYMEFSGAEEGGMGEMAMEDAPSAAPTVESAKSATTGEDQAATDYSTTNVQVEGVDEADVIKNDGQYIYMVTRGVVKIIKAYPPENMQEVVSTMKFSDDGFSPVELYVTAKKLIVVGSTYRTNGTNDFYAGSRTAVFVIDITDKANPKEVRSVAFDGNSVSSRRIGNRVYVVTSMPDYYLPMDVMSETTPAKFLPNYYDSKTQKVKPLVGCGDVRIIPNPDNFNYLTVVGLDVEDSAATLKKAVVMGGGASTVYASETNLYVAESKYSYPEVGIFDTAEQPNFSMPIWQGSRTSTALYQFSLANGDVQYKDKGDIPGNLLNQFSMDENGTTFRVVTHTDAVYSPVWREGSDNILKRATNNLYVLDRDSLSTTLGKLENIAPGEDLHAVRFLGRRAYLVTFKQIDPFFVVNLSDPGNPVMMGELKIPGYSDYLHPYDENHLIGFGKEVDPTIDADKVHGSDAVYYTAVQGLKIALFDVTDPSDPKALFKEVIGDHGTDSELLYNHKALLFDKERSLFAFPVTVAEIKNKEDRPDPWSTDGEIVFQGAYVYTLDLNKGFQLKGKITNYDEGATFDNYYSWFTDKNAIQRVLYMGNYLYGVSPGRVKAVARDTMQEVKKIDLTIPPEDIYPVTRE